MKCNRNRLPI